MKNVKRTFIGLEPLGSDEPEILILGTYPGAESLQTGEYYASTRNSFRKIIAEIFNKGVPFKTYADFEKCLKSNNIAIWDVYETCERKGSLDKTIKKSIPNDLEDYIKNHPTIRKIVFNGQEAKNAFDRMYPSGLGIATEVAPSTSNSNSKMTREQKAKEWKKIL